MSTNVEPEEMAALREGAGGPAVSSVTDVMTRDFSHPRTLSKDRLRHLSKSLTARLGALANSLAGPLRNHHKLHMGEVAEVTAHGLFDGFVKPFIVLGFPCAGRQGWLVWDSAAAAAACEIVLSGPPPEPIEDEDGNVKPTLHPKLEEGPKLLSRTEGRVVASLLDQVVAQLADPLHLDVAPGELWQEPEELTTLEDLGPDADSRRLLVHLHFEGPGSPSEMRLYLPGVVAEEEGIDLASSEAPTHLAAVGVGLSVELGSVMVPLSELLGLEVGDVVPLQARVGDSVGVRVEENIRARGRWGSHEGRMAVRIDQLTSEEDEELQQED